MSLAVIDWGLGGFSVVQKVRKKYPKQSIIYFSDAGFTPYGKLDVVSVQSRVTAIVDFLKTQSEIHQLIIACNAASVGFLNVSTISGIPTINMIDPVVDYLNTSDHEEIMVVGGDLTTSVAHHKSNIKHKSVQHVSLQPLSALIEKGSSGGKAVYECIQDRLAPYKFSTLVLACTHYPASINVFKELYASIVIVDPADVIIPLIKCKGTQDDSSVVVYTSGSTKDLIDNVLKLFGVRISELIISSV